MDAEGDALRMASWPFIILGTTSTLVSALFRWRRVNSKCRTIWKLSLTFLDASHIVMALGIITYLSSKFTDTTTCSAARTLLILGVQDCVYTLVIAAGIFRFIKSPVKLGSSSLSLKRKTSKYHVCVFLVIVVPEKTVAIIVSVLPLLPVTLPDNDALHTSSCLPIYQQGTMESEFSIFMLAFCCLCIGFAFLTIISNLMRVYLGERNRVTTPNTDFSLRSFMVVKRRLLWLLLVDAMSWIAVLTHVTLHCYNGSVQSATNRALMYFVMSVCIAMHGVLSILGSFISGAIPFPQCSACLKADTVVYRKLKKLEYIQSKENGLMYMRAMWTEDESPEHWTGILKIYNGGQLKLWSKEIIAYGMMRKSQHPNLARCLWTSKDNPFHDVMGVITGEPISPASRIICMDDHNLGTLREVAARLEQPLSAECLVRMLLDIAEGLAHLHALGIVHRQLHTTVIYLKGNVMNEVLSASIGDFEMSKTITSIGDKNDQYSFAETTVSEIYEESQCSDDFEIDIQAFALVALELFAVNCALQSKISSPDNIIIDSGDIIMCDMLKPKSNGCLRNKTFIASPKNKDRTSKADFQDNMHDCAPRESISDQRLQLSNNSSNPVERDVVESVNNLPDVVATTSIIANPSSSHSEFAILSATKLSNPSLCTRNNTDHTLLTSQYSPVRDNHTIETSRANMHPKSALAKHDKGINHGSHTENLSIALINKGRSPGITTKVQKPIPNNSKPDAVQKHDNVYVKARPNLFHVKPADNRVVLDDNEIIPENIEQPVQRKLQHTKRSFSSTNEPKLPSRVGDKGGSNVTSTKCLINETVEIVGKDRLLSKHISSSKPRVSTPTFSTTKPVISSSVQHPAINLGSASLDTRHQITSNIQLPHDNTRTIDLASANAITKSRETEIKKMILGHRSKTEMTNINRTFGCPRRIAWEAGDAWYKSRNGNNSKATNVLQISLDVSECTSESKSALSKARQRLQTAIARRTVRTSIGRKLLSKNIPVHGTDSGNTSSPESHTSTENKDQLSSDIATTHTTVSDISNVAYLPQETIPGTNRFSKSNVNISESKERNVVLYNRSVPGMCSSPTSLSVLEPTFPSVDDGNQISSVDKAHNEGDTTTPGSDLVTNKSIDNQDIVSVYTSHVNAQDLLRNTQSSKRYSDSTLSSCIPSLIDETNVMREKCATRIGKPGENKNSNLWNVDMISKNISIENDSIAKSDIIHSTAEKSMHQQKDFLKVTTTNRQTKTLGNTSHKRTILAKQNNSRKPFVNKRQSKDLNSRSADVDLSQNDHSRNTDAVPRTIVSKTPHGKAIDSNDKQNSARTIVPMKDSVTNTKSSILSTCTTSEALPTNMDVIASVPTSSPRIGYSGTVDLESYVPFSDYIPSACALKKKPRMITRTIRKRVRCSTPHPNIGRRTGRNGLTTPLSKVKGHHTLYSIAEHSDARTGITNIFGAETHVELRYDSRDVIESPSINDQASTSFNSVEEAWTELHGILDTDDSKLMRLKLATLPEKNSSVPRLHDTPDRPICPVEVLGDNIDSFNHEQYKYSEANLYSSSTYNSIVETNGINKKDRLACVNINAHTLVYSRNLQCISTDSRITGAEYQEGESPIRTSTPYPKSTSSIDASISRARNIKTNGRFRVPASPINMHGENNSRGNHINIDDIMQDEEHYETVRKSRDDTSMQSLFRPRVTVDIPEPIITQVPLRTAERPRPTRMGSDLFLERLVSRTGDENNQANVLAEGDHSGSEIPEHIILFCQELARNLPIVSFNNLIPPTGQNFMTLQKTLSAYWNSYSSDKKLWDILETCWLSSPAPSSREIADKLQNIALDAAR